MKILLGTDGSEACLSAEAFLLRWPAARSAEVIVASAFAGLTYFATMIPGLPSSVDLAQEAFDSGRKGASANAEAARDRLQAAGLNARSVAIEGSAAEALLDLAEAEGAKLIVVGSRGESDLEALLLGSVARRLVSHSPVSVVVARPSVAEKLSVLVAADGTPGSAAALDLVVAQGAGAFAKAVAVTVEPLAMLPPGVDPKVFEDVYRSDHAQALTIAEAATARLAACAGEVAVDTPLGRPAHELVAAARRHSSDLLAMGATRHGAVERFLLGSVAGEVAADAPCSVLIVRA